MRATTQLSGVRRPFSLRFSRPLFDMCSSLSGMVSSAFGPVALRLSLPHFAPQVRASPCRCPCGTSIRCSHGPVGLARCSSPPRLSYTLRAAPASTLHSLRAASGAAGCVPICAFLLISAMASDGVRDAALVVWPLGERPTRDPRVEATLRRPPQQECNSVRQGNEGGLISC